MPVGNAAVRVASPSGGFGLLSRGEVSSGTANRAGESSTMGDCEIGSDLSSAACAPAVMLLFTRFQVSAADAQLEESLASGWACRVLASDHVELLRGG
jgi:hypothetical protein